MHRLFSVDWMPSVSKALRQGMNGLVGRENPLLVGERQRDFLKVMGHHEIL